MAHKRPDQCVEHSCRLNKCLRETDYVMARCDQHLQAMIQCCREWGHTGKAFSCEGFMWMFKDEFTPPAAGGGGAGGQSPTPDGGTGGDGKDNRPP